MFEERRTVTASRTDELARAKQASLRAQHRALSATEIETAIRKVWREIASAQERREILGSRVLEKRAVNWELKSSKTGEDCGMVTTTKYTTTECPTRHRELGVSVAFAVGPLY